jgi:predicted phage gp36 major capsid-like protein
MSTHTDQALGMVTRSYLRQALASAEQISPDSEWLKLCRRVNVQDAIAGLTRERVTGAAREASDQLARRLPLDSSGTNSLRLSWETLAWATRDLQAGSGTGGGYLVSTLNTDDAAQSLLSMLVLGRLGVTAITSASNVSLPKVTANATAQWLPAETTQASESDPSFGQVNFSPHTVGAYTQISRLLTIQSRPDASALMARELMRRMRRVIEAAAFAGTGVNGQPHGIIGISGVNTVSGASFSLATACNAAQQTGDALDWDSRPGWCTDKATAFLLRQRGEVLGAVNSFVPLWSGPETAAVLASYPGVATSGMPASTGIFGNWRHLVLCDFGGGLDVSLNPYANFATGGIGVRCMATVDVGLVWPSAFTVCAGVT